MGNPKAFMTIPRKEAGYRPVIERKSDFSEVEQTLNGEDRMLQASRCMDCGVPFCHWACPLGNKMPEYNDVFYTGGWKEAYEILTETNDFPEFTGRICPALCEKSCILNLTHEPITVRENEASLTERAFEEGWIKPNPPKKRTGKKVAVIGSGPAGLVLAKRLNDKGHKVTVFEKDPLVGGLLRFGIPNFKLDKKVIDRRIDVLEKEGIEFKVNTEVGVDIKGQEIVSLYDAVCLTIGAGVPRDLPIEGRDLKGVYFALDLLGQQNLVLAGLPVKGERITAKDKRVLVIGGGDTGSDCIGTAVRQGAKSVLQIEIMPKPPEGENPQTPWPQYPMILKTTSSHKEGCERCWCVSTKKFIGKDGKLTGAELVNIEWKKDPKTGKMNMVETGKPETIEVDMVLLAMGFVHPKQEGLLNELGVKYDNRGNVNVDESNKSSVDKIFAAGDAASGASLVVRAMASACKTAEEVDRFLR